MLTITINHLSKDKINFSLENYIKLILHLKNIHKGFFEFTLIDNKQIQKLNQEYLQKNTPTDVITFNLSTPEKRIGDIYISTEQAKKQAKEYANSFENEMKLLVIHAILHLLDYEDETEKEKRLMDKEQKRIIQLAQKKELVLRYKRAHVLKSFWYAIRGIGFVIYTQRNMKIHVGFAILAIILGFCFKISHLEWLILILSIALVLMMESINTAVEVSVDLTTKKRKFRAMLSKDIAAGAVLIASLNALIVGYLIFFNKIEPYLIIFFSR